MAEAPQPSPEGAYTAYSYLTPGVDFRSFELVSEFGRVPPYVAGLTAEEAAAGAAAAARTAW